MWNSSILHGPCSNYDSMQTSCKLLVLHCLESMKVNAARWQFHSYHIPLDRLPSRNLSPMLNYLPIFGRVGVSHNGNSAPIIWLILGGVTPAWQCMRNCPIRVLNLAKRCSSRDQQIVVHILYRKVMVQ
jgi:hypothetical protein